MTYTLKKLAGTGVALAAAVALATPGIAAAGPTTVAPEVTNVTAQNGIVKYTVKNPNDNGSICGAALFPVGADTSDPTKATWPTTLAGFDWAFDGQTKNYTTPVVPNGSYVVAGQCAQLSTPSNKATAPLIFGAVYDAGSMGSLGSLGSLGS